MKRTFMLFAALLIAVFLVACGQSKTEPSSGQQDEPKEAAAEEEGKKEEQEKKVDFPKKSISLIVPYAAGGGTDLIARPLAQHAEKYLNQSIPVLNKTGGAGAVGMAEGAAAKPDGHTLTMITIEVTFLNHLGLTSLSYNDFKPILQIAFDPSTLTVPIDSPFDTIQDFINYAKEHPGELQIGNGGSGGIQHLSSASIEQATGVKFTHVPFDGGKPAVNSLLGGHIDAVVVTGPEVLDQVEAGKLKTLAVLDDKRIDSMPDVPTFKEAGYEATPLGSWKALAVPKDTPDEVVEVLAEAFKQAANEPEYVKYMKDSGLQMVIKEGQELQDMLDDQNAFFEKLIPELGLN
ncbi:tripartite tricarboxylate transporter substrate binding protein [bacterium LRH843]|nr:tripartite tricarboxylate transporter substrate binding protein [bacterium LRH843]